MSFRRLVPVLLFLIVGSNLLPHILPVLSTSAGDGGSSNALSSGVLMKLQQVSSFSNQAAPVASGDDVQVSSSTLPQNEPSIAINPSDSNRLVAGANEAVSTTNWLGVYTSSNGGLTWRSGLVPTSGLAGLPEASDPAVSFSLNGTLYYSGLAFNIQHNAAVDGTVFVSRSTDNGTTFSLTTIVSSSSGKIFNDKPYLVVDQTTGTFAGRVYVSWTRFTSSTTSDIMVSFSSDSGRSFSSPHKISSSVLNQGSVPVVGSGGDVFVVWNDLLNSRVVEAKSTDGGVSFSSPVVVSSIVPLPNAFSNSLFRVNSNPTAAADDINNNIYVAWADYGTGFSEILSSRSFDGGVTWSKPVRVNDNATNDHFFPWMTVSHGIVSVDFYDRRLDPQNHLVDVFYAESVDGGVSFSANIRVTDASFNPDAVIFSGGVSFIGDYIGIAANGTVAHPVWTDLRNSEESIFTEERRVDIGPKFAPVANQIGYPGAVLRFSVTATDPEQGLVLTMGVLGRPLGSVFASTPSTNGAVTGNFDWVPKVGQAPNNYSVEFRVSDGFLASTTNVTISVKVNSPPTLTVPGPQTVTAGSKLNFIVSASDPDIPPDNVTISCDNCAQLGASFDSSNGSFTWILAPTLGTADYMVNFTATDHLLPSLSVTESVVVHVNMLDRPPVLATINDMTVSDETLLSFRANATDPDIPVQPLTFSLGSNAPAGASISPDGVFSWTPTEAQGGTFQFTVTVSDSVLTDSKMVNVTVVEVEQPPVLTVPESQTVAVGSLLLFDVSATNPDSDDPAILSAYNLPAGASFDPDLGSFTWTPGDAQGPAFYNVTFKAVEPGPNGFSDSKTVTIQVERSQSSSAGLFAGELGLGLWVGAGLVAVILALISVVTVRARTRKQSP